MLWSVSGDSVLTPDFKTTPYWWEEARQLELRQKYVLGQDYMVPREAQRQEIGFGDYFGGIVIPDVASIHPGLYQLGLLSCVKMAGGEARSGMPVLNILRDGKKFTV